MDHLKAGVVCVLAMMATEAKQGLCLEHLTYGISLRALHAGAPECAVRRRPGASGARWVCIENRKGRTVVLEAGPMGGWDSVTAVSLYPRDSRPDDYSDCCALDSLLQGCSGFASGIRLGMSDRELLAAMGSPTRIQGDSVREFETAFPDSVAASQSDRRYFMVVRIYEVRMQKGTIRGIRYYHGKSDYRSEPYETGQAER